MISIPSGRTWTARIHRRLITLSCLLIVTGTLTVTVPLWLPLAVAVDLVRLRRRLPLTRLLSFGVIWGWAETIGIARSLGAWAQGRAGNEPHHYDLMAWWVDALMNGLRVTTGLRVEVEGETAIGAGNAVVFARHASLADSLVSAWVFTQRGINPRYVLKRELLMDPCLDVVGLRVPNCFLDRQAPDSTAELEQVRTLSSTLHDGAVAIIFPEGTRANDAKRTRARERIAERDPARAERLGGLRRLLPPRVAGAAALAAGAPDADILLVWHTGFDGLDTFGGILDRMSEPPTPAKFVIRRVARSEIPAGEQAFTAWLDHTWIAMDHDVDHELGGPQ